MNGTINGTINIYNSSGRIAMQAQVGDRVEYTSTSNNATLSVTKLTRNGVSKLPAGIYYIQSYFVTPDVVVPPVDPPTGITLKHTILVYSDGSLVINGIPYP